MVYLKREKERERERLYNGIPRKVTYAGKPGTRVPGLATESEEAALEHHVVRIPVDAGDRI